MYYHRDDEKPIIDNLLRAYRAPRKGVESPGGPDFDGLMDQLRQKWSARNSATCNDADYGRDTASLGDR